MLNCTPTTYLDYVFELSVTQSSRVSWWIVVNGDDVRYGPRASFDEAMHLMHDLFQKWRVRADKKGGWLWKQTDSRWILTVPDDIAVQHRRFRPKACSVAVGSECKGDVNPG